MDKPRSASRPGGLCVQRPGSEGRLCLSAGAEIPADCIPQAGVALLLLLSACGALELGLQSYSQSSREPSSETGCLPRIRVESRDWGPQRGDTNPRALGNGEGSWWQSMSWRSCDRSWGTAGWDRFELERSNVTMASVPTFTWKRALLPLSGNPAGHQRGEGRRHLGSWDSVRSSGKWATKAPL